MFKVAQDRERVHDREPLLPKTTGKEGRAAILPTHRDKPLNSMIREGGARLALLP